jgi:hypothetical protein
MTVTPSVLYSGGQLTNAAATLFTASVNAKTLITQWAFTNVDSVARLLTVYVVRSGGTASAANTLIDDVSIAAGETYTAVPTGVLLGAGDFIQAKADANTAITCPGISGYVIS